MATPLLVVRLTNAVMPSANPIRPVARPKIGTSPIIPSTSATIASPLARFDWTGPGINPPPPSVAVPRAGEPPRASAQVLADQVFAVLLDRIATGRLGAGDRLTEASLARAVRTSRSHVRDALRALAGSGLVDLEPHRGARVPVPQIADVVEIYAGRRALGTLVMRRATRWTPGDLDPVDRALADLLDIARTGDRHATGDADLRFQDALAEATGMRRIPPMFAALTAQLRLHIAVMGLNYAYSIAGMCVATTSLSSTTSVPGTRPPRSPPGTPRSTPRSAT